MTIGKRLKWCFIGLVAVLWTDATLGQSPAIVPYEGLIQLNQGWSRAEVELYNHSTEGTNLAPLEFFLSLPDPENPLQKFSSRLVSRYGFIASEKSPLNDHGLPIGFATDPRPQAFGDRIYVGLTCSACHTRELTYKAVDVSGSQRLWRLSVHGGPALVDIPKFKTELYDAFAKLLESEELLNQFALNLLGRAPFVHEIDSIKLELTELLGPVMETRKIIRSAKVQQTTSGPGNLNALTQGYYNNLGLIEWLVKKGAVPSSPMMVPMPAFDGADNYPPVWFSWSDDWAQWFVEIHHPGPRNWVQAISSSEVRPPKMIDSQKGAVVFSSVHFDNVANIQLAIEKLRTPKWPEELFGKLDASKTQHGRKLYVEHCGMCHDPRPLPPNEFGLVFNQRQAYDVGTDPVAYQQFAKDGAHRTMGLKKLSEQILGLRSTQLQTGFGETLAQNYMNMVSRGRPNEFGLATDRSATLQAGRWETSGAAYWAPPMAGIFSTSPYFHNGSVRTLHDVLKPAKEREVVFMTGSNEYLPSELGLRSQGDYEYNTSELGKGNAGHEFGVQLSGPEKLALLEYLKSL